MPVAQTLPRWQWKKAIAVAALVVAVVGAIVGALVVAGSRAGAFTFLQVKEVKIRVTPPLQETALRTLLPDLVGQNIVFLSSVQIVSRLQHNPWVGQVSIRKEFPDRIEITAEPRKPFAIQVRQNAPWYVARDGKPIAKVTRDIAFKERFPIISGTDEYRRQWEKISPTELLAEILPFLGSADRLSEMSFSSYPIFRLFLVSPRLEVVLSVENWKTQMPFLNSFLQHAPGSLPQTHRINLTLSKKAVVSSPISQ